MNTRPSSSPPPGPTTALPRLAFVVAALGVVGVFLFLQWLRYGEPLGLDQGLFACFGRWGLEGWLPYRDIWDQKPPGLTHVYALAFALFGVRVPAVWLLEGLVLAAESLLAFALARRLWGRWAGLIAALLLPTGLWAPQWQGYWSRAQGELWLALPVLGAAWLSLDAGERASRALWVGVLIGVAGQFKMPALALAAIWPWLWLEPRQPMAWVRRGLLLAAGMVLAWVPAFVYFALRGGVGEFYEAVFVFPRVFHHVTAEFRNWGHVIAWVPRGVWFGIPTAVVGAGLCLLRLARGRDRLLAWVLPWLLLPVVVVIIQGQMANYHYLLTVPAFAVAAGGGIAWLGESFGAGGRRRVLAAAGLLLLVVVAAGELGRWTGDPQLQAAWAYRTGAIGRDAYLRRIAQGSFEPALEEQVARVVARASAPGESLLVWGLGPGIYFLADRHPVTRYPFHHLFLTGERLSVAIGGLEQRRREFLERFDRDPPGVILVGRGDLNPFEGEDSYAQMIKFDPLRRRVQADYRVDREVGRWLVYRRGSAQAGQGAADRR
ncbi:MAG: glycosyltransferase family 39 protein [Acidobacteriota bacterium]|nr:glycosyltransferase family 39 protein [Acidobacteriota bacterium]